MSTTEMNSQATEQNLVATPGAGCEDEGNQTVQETATSPSIEEFIKERNAALISDDEEKIRAMYRKFSGGRETLPADPLTFWCAVHKARTAITSLPMSYRRASKRWLVKRGFQPQDDGEIS